MNVDPTRPETIEAALTGMNHRRTITAKELGQQPAFPCFNGSTASTCDPGLTKREWLSGMAVQGWIASFAGHEARIDPIAGACKVSEMVDALLEQLAKEL